MNGVGGFCSKSRRFLLTNSNGFEQQVAGRYVNGWHRNRV